jgi:type I restriction enzyme R subunit
MPQCYDPREEHSVVWRKLPHWSQPGTVVFITWRTWDSMPAAVVQRWQAERDDWLRRHDIDPSRPDWESLVADWPIVQQEALHSFLSDRWNEHLDELHGTCPLRHTEFAEIVSESLRHFDGERYCLCDFVVLPNHVHLLAAFATEEAMLAQCESWKHFTARTINRAIGRSGRLWEQDAFDHLVRSPEEFEHLRRYIAENPIRARLSSGQYIHYSNEDVQLRTPHAPP